MKRSLLLCAAVILGSTVMVSCSHTGAMDAGFAGQEAVPPDAAREAAIDEALQGLIFTDELVTVDPSIAGEAGSLSEAELQALMAEAEAQLARGRGIRAMAAFARAVIVAPELAAPYEGLARALIREGRSRQALPAYRTALATEPDRLDLRYAVATTLDRLHRREEAMEVWREVVAIDPDHGDAHARLAVGYYMLGLSELASHHLERAEALGGAVPAQLGTMIATGGPPLAPVQHGYDAGHAPEGAQVVVGAQVRINSNGGSGLANETSGIAIDGLPGEAIAAWNSSESGLYRVGVGVTLDGGQTWSDWEITANDSYCDPMSVGDERTGNLWVGGLEHGNLDIFLSRKVPGTTILEPADYAGAADKPWIAAGRRPDIADSTRMYVTANIDFAYSDDLGETWVSPASVSTMSGIGHLPRVGPQGELYFAYWDLGYGVKMQRSFDGGTTLSSPITIATRLAGWDIYDAPAVPGDFRVPPLSYLAVDQNDGTLYCVYFDVSNSYGDNDNVDLYLTRSTDQGSTWTTPVAIAYDAGNISGGDQFFSWLEVDSAGRLHLLFLDSRHTAQDDTASNAILDAYYSWSVDGGLTWTEHRLTPTSFDTGAASGFLGDYLGMGVGHDHAYPVYPQVMGSVHGIMSNPISWGASPLIFADGFESGDVSMWTESTP